MVVEKFVEKSAENGMDVFRVFDALNDPRNMAHAMAAVKKVGKHAQGTICYTMSPVHTVDGYIKLAGQLLDMGAESIALKDMAALLQPQPAYDIIRDACDDLGVGLVRIELLRRNLEDIFRERAGEGVHAAS